jgi:hypothetical protein
MLLKHCIYLEYLRGLPRNPPPPRPTHRVPLYCKQPVYCYDVSKHSSKTCINTHTITLLISVSVLDIVKEVQVILFKVLTMAIQVH